MLNMLIVVCIQTGVVDAHLSLRSEHSRQEQYMQNANIFYNFQFFFDVRLPALLGTERENKEKKF